MSHESSKNISPKQMKLRVREKVVQEILQSEKDYVRHLKGTYYLNYILCYSKEAAHGSKKSTQSYFQMWLMVMLLFANKEETYFPKMM